MDATMENESVTVNSSWWNATNTTDMPLPFDASCKWLSTDDDVVMTSIRFFVGASFTFVASGLVGNTLSVLVFSSREMRQMSSNVYLLALAVSDSLYLASVLFGRLLPAARCWYFTDVPLDLASHSQFFCVLQQYLSDLFADYSTCLILAFTVERCLAVFYPVAFKQRCTVARARVVCATMFSVIATSIAPYHVIMIGLYPDYHVCAIVGRYEEAFAVLYFIEMMFLRVVPVGAIALLNALIVSRVTRITQDRQRRSRRISLLPVPNEHVPMMQLNHAPTTAANGCTSGRRLSSIAFRRTRRASLDERNFQLTIILILVSSTYVLFYLPALVHFVLFKLKRSAIIDVDMRFLDVFGNYARALHIAGFAINFLLYTVSGRVFREQLVALLCRSRCPCKALLTSGYDRPPAAGTQSTHLHRAVSIRRRDNLTSISDRVGY